MDDAERYKQDQDLMFCELEAQRERAYIQDLFARAEKSGLNLDGLKLRLDLGIVTTDDIEREIAAMESRS